MLSALEVAENYVPINLDFEFKFANNFMKRPETHVKEDMSSDWSSVFLYNKRVNNNYFPVL